ncbi:hypothetical protein KEM54_001459 [Ascosphaera aggregata]|nr:hypothetical protein KEM54_001459 [Ascosphaera aggregata]
MHPESVRNRYPNFKLDGKVFAVTGGGRGIGLCIAEAMSDAGAEVHCLDIAPSPSEDFREAQNRIKDKDSPSSSLHYHTIDVRDVSALNDLFAQIATASHDGHAPRLDGLVAAAGIQQLTEALDYQVDDVHRMLDVNYTGVLMSAQAAARQMIEIRRSSSSTSMPFSTGGSIVLIASMSGLVANKGLTSCVYNSSKAAVIQLARNLAMEWAHFGIRVNSLCPGHTLTSMVRRNFEEIPALKELWEKENMLGRLADPSELSGAAIYMLSDASSFMTGTSLVVDGGHTAW